MSVSSRPKSRAVWALPAGCVIALMLMLLSPHQLIGQVDQGTITGVVQDPSGAVIGGAQVKLTDVDTGLTSEATASGTGVYVFSPVKIGHYTVSASEPNFETTVQQNLTVHVGATLNVAIVLKPGAVTETVTVSTAPPMLQSAEASVGQVMDAKTINETPLAERNWVYMAQLSTGVVPSTGTRGGGHGDYEANGQRAEQNNYLLDGVDNNVDIVDYMNGTMYAVSPPPDALAEFKLDTAAFSAEYGHSAGSVLNVALKSGTNAIHGDVWEYNRNTIFNATPWNANRLNPNPPYHFNQFGGTLGFPILKNKLFYFGDIQGTRVSLSTIGGPYSVPTPRMRNGDFSELLDTANLNGASCPTVLFAPNSDNGTYTCSGKNPTALSGALQQYGNQVTTNSTGYTYAPGQNVFNPADLNPVALKILRMYPLPNYRGWNSSNNTNPSAYGNTTNNLLENLQTNNNTVQWDQRVDWNVSARDRAYARYSYSYMYNSLTPPLGNVLDGTGNFAGNRQHYMTQNFMLSESHVFTPTLINEFRLGYNWGDYENIQPNALVNESAALGLGGVPFNGPGYYKNGGLPSVSISGIQAFGSHGNDPSVELQNIYQILDNVTKVHGNHTFKAGVGYQNFRIYFLQPPNPRGSYNFNGSYTGVTGSSGPTGFGVADFLMDQMQGNGLTNEPIDNLQYLYNSAYGEDTWKVTPRLTFTYGLRYDYFQPTGEMAGGFANFVPHTWGPGHGTADYVLPAQWQGKSIMAPQFLNLLAANNVNLVYDSNPRLSSGQKLNFAPRLGVAYQLDDQTVVRAGAGMFYGNIFGLGSNPNLGGNYPFMIHSGLGATTCVNGNGAKSQTGYSYCPSLSPTVSVSENNPASAVAAGQPGAAQNYPTTGQFLNPGDTLELGMSNQISGPNGVAGFINSTVINGRDTHIQTPYVINYNLSLQHTLGRNTSATLMYVGNVGRHLPTLITTNFATELQANGKNSSSVAGFPSLGTGNPWERFGAESHYNSLQAKLERRFSNGMSYLASYTWSHNEDNSIDPLGGGAQYRMWNIIPIKDEVTNANYDVRQRFTFNGSYELPFGKGRTFLNTAPGWVDEVIGGWTTDLTFVAQSGTPFNVGTNGIGTPSGQQSTHAIRVGDPYAGGGTPNATNAQLKSCPTTVRNRTNWYNPCAFNNPLNGKATLDPSNGVGQFPSSPITDEATALLYLGSKSNQIYGPGYERINMGITKNFTTFHEQYLQFRADAFNLLNHPTWANPSSTGLNSAAGQITSPLNLQNNVPDARFFQLAAKYFF